MLSLASAAATDEPDPPEPLQIGDPYPYDFDREQPHLAMKLRLMGDQLDLLRLDGSLESWNVETGMRTRLQHVDDAAFHALERDQTLTLRERALSLSAAGKTTRFDTSSAEHIALGHLVVTALGQTVTWQVVGNDTRKGRFQTRLPIRNALSIAPSQPWIAAATGVYIAGTGHVTDLEWINTGSGGNAMYERPEDEIVGMWNIAITDNGRLAAATQRDGRSGLIVLDVTTGDVIFRRAGFESYWIRGLSMSPDGRFLLSGDEKGWLRLWHIDRNALILERKEPLPIQSTAIDPTRRHIAWGRWDGTVAVMALDPFDESETGQPEEHAVH